MLQPFGVTTKSKRNFVFHSSLYKRRFFVLISERLFSPCIPFGEECLLCFVIPFSFTTQSLVWRPAETPTNRKYIRETIPPPITPSECPYICRELFGGAHFSERAVMNFLYEPLCNNYQKLPQEKAHRKNFFLVPHPNGHFVSLYIEGVFQEKNFLWRGGIKMRFFVDISESIFSLPQSIVIRTTAIANRCCE